ncbi:MAG: hypothetical protein COV47_04425 [Candidatus Diapherotrites archaeon CG11_big_fil_rev_8_21_14_0_20_37_9]|nr:MAG: hypothetical protein COV47_04425 [Candidatus Diapherotrites archaeon CG11_big_fil_rev_8_21_14_0_20_37_9]
MEFDTMKKGQVTIEFLLLMVLVLVYIGVIIQPSAADATNATKDTVNIAKLKLSAEKLANAIDYAGISGNGTRQTLQIVVPQNGTMSCVTKGIQFTYEVLGTGIDQCVDAAADREGKNCNVTIPTNSNFTCLHDTISGINKGMVQKATVQKNDFGAITVAITTP